MERAFPICAFMLCTAPQYVLYHHVLHPKVVLYRRELHPNLYRTAVYCTQFVLHCRVLYPICTISPCTVPNLYCIAVYCTQLVLYCRVLYPICTVPPRTVPHCYRTAAYCTQIVTVPPRAVLCAGHAARTDAGGLHAPASPLCRGRVGRGVRVRVQRHRLCVGSGA